MYECSREVVEGGEKFGGVIWVIMLWMIWTVVGEDEAGDVRKRCQQCREVFSLLNF